jgi:hypothetical protein
MMATKFLSHLLNVVASSLSMTKSIDIKYFVLTTPHMICNEHRTLSTPAFMLISWSCPTKTTRLMYILTGTLRSLVYFTHLLFSMTLPQAHHRMSQSRLILCGCIGLVVISTIEQAGKQNGCIGLASFQAVTLEHLDLSTQNKSFMEPT